MKRLILCLDGTWNSSDRVDAQTNIVRLRDFIKPIALGHADQTAQYIYYDEGVGVGTGGFFDKYSGGVLGLGLDNNIKQAYRFLSSHYDECDEIYVFGFSRGAYTARALVGLISAAGILRKPYYTHENENRAWEHYRTPKKDRLPSVDVALEAVNYAPRKIKITCLGLFDTVGALGIPGNWFQFINRRLFAFHDTQLSSLVQNGFHAIAIDEKRKAFNVTLWDKALREDHKHIHQVWFSGVHSDIGGGYYDKQVSENSLKWMINKIQSLNLGLEFFDNVNKINYYPNSKQLGILHDSRWSWLSCFNLSRVMLGVNAKRRVFEIYQEKIHWTVLKRYIDDSTYRPSNLLDALNTDEIIWVEGENDRVFALKLTDFNKTNIKEEIEGLLKNIIQDEPPT
jgi:uncharacterized protein (DUF2235 family)